MAVFIQRVGWRHSCSCIWLGIWVIGTSKITSTLGASAGVAGMAGLAQGLRAGLLFCFGFHESKGLSRGYKSFRIWGHKTQKITSMHSGDTRPAQTQGERKQTTCQYRETSAYGAERKF